MRIIKCYFDAWQLHMPALGNNFLDRGKYWKWIDLCLKPLLDRHTFPRKHIPCESFLSLLGRSNFVASLRTSSCRKLGRDKKGRESVLKDTNVSALQSDMNRKKD
jgi:hypothetical protein